MFVFFTLVFPFSVLLFPAFVVERQARNAKEKTTSRNCNNENKISESLRKTKPI